MMKVNQIYKRERKDFLKMIFQINVFIYLFMFIIANTVVVFDIKNKLTLAWSWRRDFKYCQAV